MQRNYFIYIPLLALVLIGLIGALRISYANYLGSVCPHIFLVPVCYVVTAAYALMFLALAIAEINSKHYLFVTGWGLAFVVALAGSASEFFSGGGVCPGSGGARMGGASGSGLPLCYLSLAMLIVILALFLAGPYRRACALHNAHSA